ncbi:MAG: hypothetical protein WCK75_07440 [Elusimicrobiota bacterium]
MDKAMDFLINNWLAEVAAVGGWVLGFTSDLFKEHLRHKRERKEEHAKVIKKEILMPICEYLKAFYFPICEVQDTPIGVTQENITKNPGHITEDAYAGTRFVIHARIPERPTGRPLQSEYWHEPEGFQRYYADAKEVHYPELLARWEAFRKKFTDMQQESLKYSSELLELLKTELKMEAFSPMATPKVPWVSYERIAYVIFKRHMGLDDEGIRYDSYTVGAKTSKTQQEVFKCASAPDAEKALEIVNGIPKNHEAVDTIKMMCKHLAVEANLLLTDFRFETSKAPKPRSCKFV